MGVRNRKRGGNPFVPIRPDPALPAFRSVGGANIRCWLLNACRHFDQLNGCSLLSETNPKQKVSLVHYFGHQDAVFRAWTELFAANIDFCVC